MGKKEALLFEKVYWAIFILCQKNGQNRYLLISGIYQFIYGE